MVCTVMSGAEGACLVFYLFHAPELEIVDVPACISSPSALLKWPAVACSCTTRSLDASVVRNRVVVWHVKGRPRDSRLGERWQYGGPFVADLQHRPRFKKLQPTRTLTYPEPFLSCTHLGTELLPTKPHTHTPQSDLRAPTVLIIP